MWYFISYFFRALTCHMSMNFIFPYVKRSINIFIYQTLANKYCIFRIVTLPRHISY
uniref:Uncharacterized protein n=1 Tax=Solanum lycopersicum TaxID=4081 RepID=A0A3Q7JU08_SOLLC